MSSPRFGEAARSLADTLIEKMGFEPDEAATLLEVRQAEIPGLHPQGDLLHRAPVLLETLDAAPDLTGLEPETAARVRLDTRLDGTVTISVHGEISDDLAQRLMATAATPERRGAVLATIHRHRIAHQNTLAPAERGATFAVPRLFLNVQGELELAEEELILDLGGWSLNDYKAELTPEEFSIRETAERWEVDLRGEKVVYTHLDQQAQLEIGLLKLEWTDLELSRWLDRECRRPDITQPVMLEFCRKIVVYLTGPRGMALSDLLRFKYQLAKAVQLKIAGYCQQAYARDYQTCLFGPEARVETSFADGFRFDNRPYPTAWCYQGSYQFKKHFFGPVGELENKGEEFECAKIIDTLSDMKYWVRNLAGRAQTSFWLPTSTDRFYPDFVAELNDGRLLVVEYKGSHLADTADTKEKRNIGELWAAKSNRKGLFLMAEKSDRQSRDVRGQLAALIQP